MAQLGDDAALQLARAGVTRRELEVLRCLVQRLSNREVADRLSVSVRTVESHVSSRLARRARGPRCGAARPGGPAGDEPPLPLVELRRAGTRARGGRRAARVRPAAYPDGAGGNGQDSPCS